MDFDYIVADPTGNITVLVRSPYTADNRQQIIREAFSREPSCEQVGFIMPVSDKMIRLEMMGYEFCGNATLSAAAWQAQTNGLPAGDKDTIMVDSSGADEVLAVKVRHLEDLPARTVIEHDKGGSSGTEGIVDFSYCMPLYEGTVSMPKPEVSSFRGYPLISFTGISHLIVPEETFTGGIAEQAVKEYAHELGVPALGMMLCPGYEDLISGRGASRVTISPLVYVPGLETLFWEHGCATGSTAVGWYRYHTDPANISTQIKQPGGIIRVDVAGGQPMLTGKVVFRSGR